MTIAVLCTVRVAIGFSSPFVSKPCIGRGFMPLNPMYPPCLHMIGALGRHSLSSTLALGLGTGWGQVRMIIAVPARSHEMTAPYWTRRLIRREVPDFKILQGRTTALSPPPSTRRPWGGWESIFLLMVATSPGLRVPTALGIVS